MIRPHWTPQETELAEELVRKNATDRMCWAQLNRSKKSCVARLRRIGCRAIRPAVPMNHYVINHKIQIPPEVYEERNRRLMARMDMDLTAQLCGDPPRGYSAKDRT